MPAWFAWSLLALVCWGVWAILGRVIGPALSPAHSQALSTIGMLPVLAVLPFLGRNQPSPGPRKGMLVALGAGVLSCLGNLTYYDALNRGPKAATVVPLTAMYPLVTIVLALILLRERLNRLQLCGIAFSLAAIYLLNISSSSGFFNPWMLLALVPIGLWGVVGFLQKLSTNDIPGERATLWFLAMFIVFAVVIVVAQPLPARIAPKTWFWVLALGFFFALGNLAILMAFARNGKASVITPLTAMYPAVSIPLAVLLLGERIAPREGAGIVLALASVVALSWQPPVLHEVHH